MTIERSGPADSVLAFDLGASSGRAMIGELTGSGGERALSIREIHRFENKPIAIGRHLHWNIVALFEELKTGIRLAFEAGYRPASFGIDTWGVDFGLLDRNGELLGLPYHYRDPQTNGLIEELNERIGEEKLFRESGLQQMPFNTLYQLYAMKKAQSPKLEAAQTLLLTPDLLNYFLTGEMACEYTMATTTQLYDPGRQDWNAALLRELGLPEGMFLPVVRPGTKIGELREEVRRELGVPAVAAIAVGSHDTESAAAAVPADGAEFAYLVCGTWSLLGTSLPQAVLTPEAQRLNFSNEGGVGGTVQLLKNIMGLWLLQECKRKWDREAGKLGYGELVREAAEAEPFRSLIDPDDLRFMNPADMEAEIAAFCVETGQPAPKSRGEVVRCILESLALRYRTVLDQIERLNGLRFDGLHMVGGGIQNELLCRFAAGAVGRPVWAGPVEASAIGNLLVQFEANGMIADLQQGLSLVKAAFPLSVYEPERADEWQTAYERYERLARSI